MVTAGRGPLRAPLNSASRRGQPGVDELESELRTLDREIAQFVLEAFQRQAPEALRDQLATAMADSLRPLQRAIDSLDASLADTRGDMAQSAQAAEAAAERRTAALQQAIARLRSGPPAAGAAPAESAAADEQPDLFHEPQSAPRRRYPETMRPHAPDPDGGWWRRNLAWVAAGAVVLVIAAGGLVYLLNPAGLPGLGPRPAATAGLAPTAGEAAATGAAASSPDQEGFARVLGQVALWSGARRTAALEALCGPGADAAGCPDLETRWAPGARTRKEADAALAVVVAALAETDGCAALPAQAAAAPAKPETKAEKREKAAETAVAEADPQAALRCLLTEAGRAPRP